LLIHRYLELSQNSICYYLVSLCPEASTHQVLPTQMPVYDKQTIQLKRIFNTHCTWVTPIVTGIVNSLNYQSYKFI
jgi:hypothetical protein